MTVFQNARVLFGMHQVLRLAVERDDGDLVGAGLHDLEVAPRPRPGACLRDAAAPCRPAIFGAHDLDDLGRQAAAVVERREAARAEQTLEPAVTREERTLVVLDDNLELEQHDTSPIISLQFPSPCGEGLGAGGSTTAKAWNTPLPALPHKGEGN